MKSAWKNFSRKSAACALALSLILGAAGPIRAARPLLLSKSLPHYMREMEFYYLAPRPEIIPGLFRSLRDAGVLARNEARLMLAAFLAALAGEGRLDLESLAPLARELGDDAVKTLAWSLHLANCENAASDALLAADAPLRKQIGQSPAPLEKWPPLTEPSTIQMYWTAFMATGKNLWLDGIIGAALEYGRLRSQGRWREHDHQVGERAAASLFEFAKTHERVRQRLKERLRGARDGAEAALLRQILQEGE